MANHNGVDDGHAHPAKLGKNEGQGEAHRGWQFFVESFQANHGLLCDEVYGEESEQANLRVMQMAVSQPKLRARPMRLSGQIPGMKSPEKVTENSTPFQNHKGCATRQTGLE
jgi:hypothetical protein